MYLRTNIKHICNGCEPCLSNWFGRYRCVIRDNVWNLYNGKGCCLQKFCLLKLLFTESAFIDIVFLVQNETPCPGGAFKQSGTDNDINYVGYISHFTKCHVQRNLIILFPFAFLFDNTTWGFIIASIAVMHQTFYIGSWDVGNKSF